jgi:hypothetical protein
MRRTLLAQTIGIFALQCGIAQAACHSDQGMQIYDGTIGKTPVRVALVLGNGPVEGRYAYQVSTSDIVLKGQLDAAGKHLTLTELDASGHPKATFDGTFADHGPQFANGATLNCEVVTGKWQMIGQPPVDFRLSSDSSGSMQFGHLYDAAGVTDDEAVNKAAEAFRNAVIHNQRDVIAKIMIYPFETNVNGKRTNILSAKTFLAQYDRIFTPAFRATIASDIPRLMFVRDQGVMLGGGEVWFDPDGKVITLNN